MSNIRSIATLLPYLRNYQLKLWVGVICVTLSNLAATISPLILKTAIDRLGKSTSPERLLLYGLLILLFAVLKGIFLFLMRKIMIGVSRYLEYDLRNDLFAHLLGLTPKYFQNEQDRRHHVKSDERFIGCPHDAGARDHVFREYDCPLGDCIIPDVSNQPFIDPVCARQHSAGVSRC